MDYRQKLNEEFGIVQSKPRPKEKKSEVAEALGFKDKLTGKWVYRWQCINSREFENIHKNIEAKLEKIKVN